MADRERRCVRWEEGVVLFENVKWPFQLSLAPLSLLSFIPIVSIRLFLSFMNLHVRLLYSSLHSTRL